MELANAAQVRHNRGAVRADELRQEIEALEEENAALQSAEQEEDSAVMALSAELEARRDQLSLKRRALADHQERMEERRAQLDEAMAEEARLALERVLQDREEAGKSVAEAAELVLASLDALDALQEAARSAWTTAGSHAKVMGKRLDAPTAEEIEAGPEVMRESWERLCDEVRKRTNEEFEGELVAAAARSPMGYAIKDLPAHLQELARQRRNALFKERSRERSETQS
jgi:DNA repair exonuclease SbcCD ATPase subunit